jgi:hypothetical protein
MLHSPFDKEKNSGSPLANICKTIPEIQGVCCINQKKDLHMETYLYSASSQQLKIKYIDS